MTFSKEARMVVRKRGGKRPGAGRKADPSGAKTVNYNARVSADTLERLKAEAEEDGVSVAQLAGLLIRDGLKERSKAKTRDPETTALCFLVGELAELLSTIPVSDKSRSFPWRRDPFVFEAFRLALDSLMTRIKPTGPQKSILARHPELKGTDVWGSLDSADDRARWAVDAVVGAMMVARPSELDLPDGMPAAILKMVTKTVYGLADARRDLGYLRRDPSSRSPQE
jgi:hypothetical protein